MEDRLAAVERALTESETPPAALSDATELEERVTAVEERLAALETELAELDAGLQAVRGYAGAIRATNREVERRADAALAAVEELEHRLADDSSDGPPARVSTVSEEPIPEPDRTFEPPESEDGGPLARLRDAL